MFFIVDLLIRFLKVLEALFAAMLAIANTVVLLRCYNAGNQSPNPIISQCVLSDAIFGTVFNDQRLK